MQRVGGVYEYLEEDVVREGGPVGYLSVTDDFRGRRSYVLLSMMIEHDVAVTGYLSLAWGPPL